ncbi:MAG: FAD-binding oxidoreductase, partial [Bdellovibrionales bacterium]|nr:FAD-binding oxidoreductase [Bdellovibrionales bacterium]
MTNQQTAPDESVSKDYFDPRARKGATGSRGKQPAFEPTETRRLYQALTRAVAGEVRFDPGTRSLYATDSSNFRQVPIGVVVPRTLDDVVAAHRICSRFNAPILNRGGGTSLSGETVNFAVVIDHSKYLRHIGVPDAERRLITVENGAVNEQVNEVTATVGLAFGPDPSSHRYCTIGGNVGNDSCGIHSVQSQLYGPGPRTADNVHSMEIVTYDGARFPVGVNEEAKLDRIVREGGRKAEIYAQLRDLRDRYADLIRKRYPSVEKLPRRVSGYNLDELLPERGFNVARALVGTEGTCATALQVTLMLTPALAQRATLAIAYDDIADACEHVSEIMEWKPVGLEGIDHQLFVNEHAKRMYPDALRYLPQTGENAWLLVEFGAGRKAELVERTDAFTHWLVETKHYDRSRIALFDGGEGKGRAEALWKIREGGLGATAFDPDGTSHWPGWEDSAVPPESVGSYIRELRQLYHKYGYRGA